RPAPPRPPPRFSGGVRGVGGGGVPTSCEPLYERPPPLVPRQFRFEVGERTGPRGEVLRPLDEADVRAAAERIRAAGIEAVAVCYLHSYSNADHERRTGEILREILPGAFISLSVDVLPQKLEYERTSTTVINAYVGPPVKHYVRSMVSQIQDAGIGGRLMVMQSSGGILDADAVAESPARIVECGPAAGVVGARHFAARAGFDNVITLDMGGTTAKASLIEGGRITFAEEYEVGGGMSSRSALMGGGGYALKLPVIDISEVGAGGGSIAGLDKAGSLKVGPQSAGAVPGPACYDTGNDEPTVTDANVVLGYLNPESLAGGSVRVRPERAHEAIRARLANPLRRDVVETAFGVHTVANANMMKAVKAVTTYRGRDPRDFTLIAFGGSGGVHAVDLARVLQVRRVVLPVAAGVFSALGLLFSNLEMNETVPFLHLAAGAPLDEAERRYEALAKRISAVVGGARDDIRFSRQADVRFAGQAYELTVPFGEVPDEGDWKQGESGVDPGGNGEMGARRPVPDDARLDARAVADLCGRFEAEHLARYGHAFSGEFPVEIVNLRLVGTRRPAGTVEPARFDPASHAGPDERRNVYFGPAAGLVETPVIGRGRLGAEPCPGPMIIEEYEGTCVVPPACSAGLDGLGNVVIELPAVRGAGEW
ncbi:MAG: hydantoinase/oxoprolinase family protein, partial [Thiotrichales bacterium]|nr:hydantoinase/oxoprolinase family protein [Thiotrichales bacterium]